MTDSFTEYVENAVQNDIKSGSPTHAIALILTAALAAREPFTPSATISINGRPCLRVEDGVTDQITIYAVHPFTGEERLLASFSAETHH